MIPTIHDIILEQLFILIAFYVILLWALYIAGILLYELLHSRVTIRCLL